MPARSDENSAHRARANMPLPARARMVQTAFARLARFWAPRAASTIAASNRSARRRDVASVTRAMAVWWMEHAERGARYFPGGARRRGD